MRPARASDDFPGARGAGDEQERLAAGSGCDQPGAGPLDLAPAAEEDWRMLHVERLEAAVGRALGPGDAFGLAICQPCLEIALEHRLELVGRGE